MLSGNKSKSVKKFLEATGIVEEMVFVKERELFAKERE
jgi:hypothetical protein